jgi:hypothetical protein
MTEKLQRLTPALIRRTLTYRWVCLGLLLRSGPLAFFTRLAPTMTTPDLRAPVSSRMLLARAVP